jgi:nucleoside-diphosphate-sugar epimerase
VFQFLLCTSKPPNPPLVKGDAKQILGWEPKFSRLEGLKLTYDYFLKVIKAKKKTK